MNAQGQPPVRVLVVDNGAFFGDVLCAVVAATDGFEVVGVASSGREALDLVDLLDAQLVVLDVETQELAGIEIADQIRRRYADAVILLLTATRHASLRVRSLAIEDKQDVSPQWLTDFWRRQRRGR